MFNLNTLPTIPGAKKKRMRVGRGAGSGKGQTSGRGTKGEGARSGTKRRWGREGGQVPLFKKTPTRGFSRARFQVEIDTVNLGQIDILFNDGEIVNSVTLREKGFLDGRLRSLKILAKGDLTKKVTIEANQYSQTAKEKLESAKISYKTIEA
jgi:large subunit ribosomal protein L15